MRLGEAYVEYFHMTPLLLFFLQPNIALICVIAAAAATPYYYIHRNRRNRRRIGFRAQFTATPGVFRLTANGTLGCAHADIQRADAFLSSFAPLIVAELGFDVFAAIGGFVPMTSVRSINHNKIVMLKYYSICSAVDLRLEHALSSWLW